MSKPTVDFASRKDGTPAIIRHNGGARVIHWALAIAFIISTMSGLALFHPSTAWMGELFGSGTWNRILHPFFGIAMFVFFILLGMRYWNHNFFDKNDVKWLMSVQYVVTGESDKLPPIGMYNAGQKILFWSLTLIMLGLLASGIVLWRDFFTFGADLKAWAALLHALLAFALVCFIIVHVFATIMAKESLRAMIDGTVSYAWAKHNHSAWYEEIVEAENAAANKK